MELQRIDWQDAAVDVIPRSMAWSPNYDHLGVHSNDLAQSIALEMMADAGTYMLGRALGTGIGGVIGAMTGAPTVGIGVGNVLSGMAQDAWLYLKHKGMAKDPNAFWQNFKDNLAEARDENSSIDDFMEGAQTRLSFIGGAGRAQEQVQYEGQTISVGAETVAGRMPEWTGAHQMGDMFGYIVKDMAATLAGGQGVAPLVGLTALSEATQKATETLGMNESMQTAMKSAAIYGLASGATGWLFMHKLPPVFKAQSGKFLNSTFGTSLQRMSPLVKPGVDVLQFATEFAAWGATEEALIGLGEGRGFHIDPVKLGGSFGLGLALSLGGKGLGKMFKATMENLDNGVKPTPENVKATAELLQIEYQPTIAGLLPYYPKKNIETVVKATPLPPSMPRGAASFITGEQVSKQVKGLALKGDGTFLNDILSNQEIAGLAGKIRDKGLLNGFEKVVDGSLVRDALYSKGERAYNAVNVNSLLKELDIIAPNINNKAQVFEVISNAVQRDIKALDPVTVSFKPVRTPGVGQELISPTTTAKEPGVMLPESKRVEGLPEGSFESNLDLLTRIDNTGQ